MAKLGLKRILAMLVALFLVFSFAACKEKTGTKDQTGTTRGTTAGTQQGEKTQAEEKSYVNKEGFPICNETITITVSGAQSTTPDWNDTLMVQEIEKRFGIKMECSPVPDEAWQTQLTLMLSTKELPDFIINAGISLLDAAKHGQDGLLLPFNQYSDYIPNIKRTFSEYPAYERAVTAPDGNVYGLTQLNLNKTAQVPRTFLDRNWLERLNLPYPKTLDDIYNILVAFRDNDANGNGDPNDEIPFSTVVGSLDFYHHVFLASFGLIGNQHYFNLQVDENGKVYLAEATDNYRNYLRFLHKLYDEKLLDQECFIQTQDEFNAKIREGRVGMFGHWAPYVGAGQNIDFDINYVYVGGLTSEYNNTPTIPLSSQVTSGVKCIASANTKYPEAIARLIDYFYSEEGTYTGRMGFQGVSWDFVDVEGIPGAKVGEVFHPEGYDSAENFRTRKAIINNLIMIYSTLGTQYAVIEKATEEQLDEILIPRYGWAALIQKYGFSRPDLVLSPVFPELVYTNEESDIILPIKNDITLFVENSKAMFVTGESDINSDSAWKDYVNRLEQIGLGRMLEAIQAAYDRYMGK